MGKTFFKKVARCKRCGGILTGEESIRKGYGPSCYKNRDKPTDKATNQGNEKEVVTEGQITIFDILGEEYEQK